MTKVYSMGKSSAGAAAFIPLPEEYVYHQNQKSWIEKFALRWLKCAIFALIVTMIFLVITQQLLNRELARENERLRKFSAHEALDNELLAHPYFEKYGNEFEEFKQKFEKTYENKHEEHRRKLIFLNRMQQIDEWNNDEANLLGNSYGANQFSDMTDDEFKKLLLPLDYYSNLRKHATFLKQMDNDFVETAVNHPPRFDWREKGVVTPVKSQANCGSCWAFAATATVESAYAVAHGELRNLSEQVLLDCNSENNACDGGDADKAFRFVHDTGSILSTFFFILINLKFTSSSPHIHVLNIELKENDPFCIKSNQENATILNYILADYIPRTDNIQFNEEWMFYIFDGLVATSVGIALGLLLLEFLNMFFEDEMRIHGFVKGIYVTIHHEVITLSEFSYNEAQRQLEYGFGNNFNNNDSFKRNKPSRAAAYVTRANK